MDLTFTLNFLSQLAENNHKSWFDAHRAEYEQAREQFLMLIDRVIDELRPVDNLKDTRARDCILRINRDIRFSKDKSPYHAYLGASIALGGRKAQRFGYYIHLSPVEGTFIAGGMYQPDPAQLIKFRQAIDLDPQPLKDILANPAFAALFGGLSGERIKTVPQGYSRDHPEIELLRMKSAIAYHLFPPEEVTSENFPEMIVTGFAVMKPYLDYLNEFVGVLPQL